MFVLSLKKYLYIYI